MCFMNKKFKEPSNLAMMSEYLMEIIIGERKGYVRNIHCAFAWCYVLWS